VHHGGDCGCGQDCGGSCGGRGHDGGGSFTLLGSLLGYHKGAHGCSILGCGSHYLDPQGACYGAYCGSCCEQAGCGCMYWGDYWNVPPTTDPCDCCQNYVGPSHSPHGSTPCYYGPAPPHHGPHLATTSAPHEGEIVVEQPPAKAAAPTKTVSRPAAKTTQR
jgi:hypothetical protein